MEEVVRVDGGGSRKEGEERGVEGVFGGSG
jgi:hypothetical protein